jgi:hypothetical protein
MKINIVMIGVFLFAFPFLSRADEVTLKQGKVLTGTIVQEDKDEIGITLGEGMFLRVDRSNIQSITRSSEDMAPSPVHKRDPFEPRSNTGPTPKTKPTLAPPAGDVVRSKKMAVEYIVISETIVEKKVFFAGKKMTDARSAVLEALKETATEEVRSKALLSKFDCAWVGKSAPSGAGFGWRDMEIVSTMTFVQADWQPGLSPRRDETEAWDQLSAQLKLHDDKVLKNYEDTLQDVAQVMSTLQLPSGKELQTETDLLVKERISRADKKKRAIDRLTESAILKINVK